MCDVELDECLRVEHEESLRLHILLLKCSIYNHDDQIPPVPLQINLANSPINIPPLVEAGAKADAAPIRDAIRASFILNIYYILDGRVDN